jgi:hypothetical protein
VADRDTVRLLIADVDPSNQLLTDAQLDSLLALEDGNIKLAAAQALDTIASSEALVSKVIRTQDLQTDGSKTAAALRAHAAALRAQAQKNLDDVDEGYFEIIPGGPAPVPELTERWW